MVKTEKKDIGGLRFTTVQFAAMRSFELLARLLKVIGPAFGSLMELDPEVELDTQAMSALAPALASLNPKEAADLVREVLQSTSVWIPDASGGRELEFAETKNIDAVFSGKLKSMFSVLGFVLQVNFSDFFDGSVPAAPTSTPTTKDQT